MSRPLCWLGRVKVEIKRKDIREGDHVIITRAGDVIPKIKGVNKALRKASAVEYIFPSHCPSCGSQVSINHDEAAIRCSAGLICKEQLVERLMHFVSRNAFNIDGLGESQIRLFYEKNLIKSPADIFTLEERDLHSLTKIRNFPGFGTKSSDNLFESIKNSKNITLDKLIYSLGIRHVGANISKLLARYYKNIENFYEPFCLFIF